MSCWNDTELTAYPNGTCYNGTELVGIWSEPVFTSTTHLHRTSASEEYYKYESKIKILRINTQPSYLHNLISVQPPRCTRTSSVVTLSRPPASSSLKITNRSFRHASPHLWNKLPASLRQPCLNQSSSPSSSSLSPLSSSITPSLFHSKLKAYLFQKSFPP